MIYADVHVVTAESNRFETILDDDQVEYAELNHSIKMTNKRSQRNMATSEDFCYGDFIDIVLYSYII